MEVSWVDNVRQRANNKFHLFRGMSIIQKQCLDNLNSLRTNDEVPTVFQKIASRFSFVIKEKQENANW